MSKDKNGAAALSGLVSFLVVTNVLSTESMAKTLHIAEGKVDLAFGDISNVFCRYYLWFSYSSYIQ